MVTTRVTTTTQASTMFSLELKYTLNLKKWNKTLKNTLRRRQPTSHCKKYQLTWFQDELDLFSDTVLVLLVIIFDEV